MIIKILTLSFFAITLVVGTVNGLWCWKNRTCDPETSVFKMKSYLWGGLVLSTLIGVVHYLVAPCDIGVYSLAERGILAIISVNFLLFHLGFMGR